MAIRETDQPIRILHLSDIHFRASKAWDADPVLRALAGSIESEVAKGLVPDLVVITGDIAFAGIAKEYALARTWLDTELWPKLSGLPRDRLLLVPGNHDVDRGKVDYTAEAVQGSLLTGRDQDQIATVLGTKGQRATVLKRHTAYLKFVSGWLGKAQPLPWWQRVIGIRGTKLHVAGLDSAWMACGDEDRGRLLLGRWQINQTVDTRQAEKAGWRIALLHHPWDSLADFEYDEAREVIHQHCDLLLRGHLHKPRPERVLPPDPARSCLELPTGCVYENSQYPNAFQWIELWPSPAKRVRVLFRAWQHNAWTIDRTQPGCEDGHWQVDFAASPTSAIPAAGAVGSAKPTIPPEYFAWLRQRYASVELLGQDPQQGLSVTLSQVYVPALTQPAATAATERVTERDRAGATEERRLVPLLQRLDEESLYVPASPGAGKSTFCRWAALQSIPGASMIHPVPAPKEYEEPAPTALRARLPLLVPLREFWTAMDCGQGRRTWSCAELAQALAAWVDRSPPAGLTGALLKDHLGAGSAFMLLDGLDEVPISETRDGATVFPRERLLSGLADALPAWLKAGNRIVLTSRPYGLDEAGLDRLGLTRAPMEPLPQPLQDLFVTRWFHTLNQRGLADDLIATMRAREDLVPLAENPMLLTALCVIYGTGRRLPEDRYHLYQRIVDNVLFNRYPGDAKQREPVKARLEAIALGMHTGEEDAPRQTPVAEVGWGETERLLREFAALNPVYESGHVQPAVQREELMTRSGLLLPKPDRKTAFYHLSFQEFLAAERIARSTDDRQALDQVFRARGVVAEWRPTLAFLFAAQIFNYRDAQWGLDLLARLIADQERVAVNANPATAVFIAEALELCLAKGYRIPDALAGNFRRLALDAIDDEIAVQDRQALGLCLGRLGDPRVRGLRDPEAYVEFPAGRYPYGDEKKMVVEIKAPFRIGQYPVTNGQYQAFLDDDGYHDVTWWSEAGWAWLQGEKVTEPLYWRDRRWNSPNQPVVGVSFWEAEACSTWAGGRLPSEQEWEAAARGSKGFAYPWGDDWQDGICNTVEAGPGVTSPVGLFPRARQAGLGIEDLAGNVWEWCDSLYDAHDKGFPDARVLRGGSWYSYLDYARSASRGGNNPDDRSSDIGFVWCVRRPSSTTDF